MARFLFCALACVCFFGDPTWVGGNSVPAGQAEAVAQVIGAMFIIGAIILDKFNDLEEELRKNDGG